MRILYKFISEGSDPSGHACMSTWRLPLGVLCAGVACLAPTGAKVEQIPVILCLAKIIGKFIENLFTNSNIAYIMFYVRPNKQNASMAQLVERLIRNQ